MKKKLRMGVYLAFILAFLWSVILLVIRPEARTGPFGVGLPAKMKVFTSKIFDVSIQYPESWSAFEARDGNHGDQEIIAWINVPGRLWPFLSIARHDFPGGDLDQAILWGLTRIEKTGGVQNGTILPRETTKLSGKYFMYSYQSTSPLFVKKTIICQSSFFFENSKGYMLSFCSEKDLWDELLNVEIGMIDSFTLR